MTMVRRSAADSDPGLPLRLDSCSNGEYPAPPTGDLANEAMRRARHDADAAARALGWSRRRFLVSSAGMASGLAALQACSDERARSRDTEPGGTFAVPTTATTDVEEATTVVHGADDDPITDGGAPFGRRPQPSRRPGRAQRQREQHEQHEQRRPHAMSSTTCCGVLTSRCAVTGSVGPLPKDGHQRAIAQAPQAGVLA